MSRPNISGANNRYPRYCCPCATCHVYVDEARADRLPPVEEQDDAMLESTAAKRRANRRLPCCLTMNDAPDGIVVHLPARQ